MHDYRNPPQPQEPQPIPQPQEMPYGWVEPQPQYSGKGTAALTCGIIAIVLAFLFPPGGIILAIVALVLASSALKQLSVDSRAKSGRVCGFIGLVLSIIVTIVTVVILVLLGMRIYSAMETEGWDPATHEEAFVISVAANEELSLIAAQDEEALATIASICNQRFLEGTGYTMEECGIDPMEYARTMTEGFIFEPEGPEDENGALIPIVETDVYVKDSFEAVYLFETFLSEKDQAIGLENLDDDEARAFLGEAAMLAVQSAGHIEYETVMYFFSEGGAWVLDQEMWEAELAYMFSLF